MKPAPAASPLAVSAAAAAASASTSAELLAAGSTTSGSMPERVESPPLPRAGPLPAMEQAGETLLPSAGPLDSLPLWRKVFGLVRDHLTVGGNYEEGTATQAQAAEASAPASSSTTAAPATSSPMRTPRASLS